MNLTNELAEYTIQAIAHQRAYSSRNWNEIVDNAHKGSHIAQTFTIFLKQRQDNSTCTYQNSRIKSELDYNL